MVEQQAISNLLKSSAHQIISVAKKQIVIQVRNKLTRNFCMKRYCAKRYIRRLDIGYV